MGNGCAVFVVRSAERQDCSVAVNRHCAGIIGHNGDDVLDTVTPRAVPVLASRQSLPGAGVPETERSLDALVQVTLVDVYD